MTTETPMATLPSWARCESCGKPADVGLADGSHWCFGCDASARNQGYDDDPIVAMRAFARTETP